MADLTAISVARTALYDALRADTFLSSWRVHRVPPRQIAAPTIYIDESDFDPNGTFMNVLLNIVLVHDGAVRAQVEALDDMLAHAATAALTVGDAERSRSVSLDVGGPTLRSKMIPVAVLVLAHTLCTPTLVTTPATPLEV